MSPVIDALTTAPSPVIAEIKPRTAAGEELVGTRSPSDIARANLETARPWVTTAWRSRFTPERILRLPREWTNQAVAR